MNIDPVEAFRSLLRSAIAKRLAELRTAIERAVLLGQPLDVLRAQYLAVEAIEAGIAWPAEGASVGEAAAALAAQWPADLIVTPLPMWFADPAAAAALDPPGEPCVVSFGEG